LPEIVVLLAAAGVVLVCWLLHPLRDTTQSRNIIASFTTAQAVVAASESRVVTDVVTTNNARRW
jgi:hypothetical protein